MPFLQNGILMRMRKFVAPFVFSLLFTIAIPLTASAYSYYDPYYVNTSASAYAAYPYLRWTDDSWNVWNHQDYCYSGYGCYPLQVDDPHQWVYDAWTGTWY
jgi:hypothetical protein